MGQVIAVVQQKGGSGKTTIAAHLAVGLKRKNHKILIVDLDSQESLKTWFELRSQRKDDLTFLALNSWNLSTELTRQRSKYDFIVIDSPPHLDSETKNAIKNADLLIVPMQPSPTDLWATERILDLLEYNSTNYSILLNRYNPHYKTHQIITEKLQNKNIFKNFLSNRIAFATSMVQGLTIMETEPKSPAVNELNAVIDEIIVFFKKIN